MPAFIVKPAQSDPRFRAFAAGAWPAPKQTTAPFAAFAASDSNEPGWADRRVTRGLSR